MARKRIPKIKPDDAALDAINKALAEHTDSLAPVLASAEAERVAEAIENTRRFRAFLQPAIAPPACPHGAAWSARCIPCGRSVGTGS
jgi:hypothetical protein